MDGLSRHEVVTCPPLCCMILASAASGGLAREEEQALINLVLVGDQPAGRGGLRMRLLLEPDLIVVGEASTAEEVLTLVPQLTPDVVLMDMEMRSLDVITLTAALRAQALWSAVVIVSLHEDTTTQARAHSAGAVALVKKNGSCYAELSAIRQAFEHGKRTAPLAHTLEKPGREETREQAGPEQSGHARGAEEA